MQVFILGLIAWLVMMSGGVQANEARLDKIKDSGVLRVCIWPGYYAISYRDPDTGKLNGIDIDMAREFASYLGAKLQFVDSSFAKLKRNMTRDGCDISMHGVGIRQDRKRFMNFSEPHLKSGIYAVVHKSNANIHSWNDIDQHGRVVVVQKGSFMEPVMRSYLKRARMMIVDNFKAREKEVLAGRADVFMTDFPYGMRMVAKTQWAKILEPEKELSPTYYAYAVPKREPEWLNVVNKFLQKSKENGRLEKLANKHGLGPILVK
jgi:ABC-type amino acid transport substrate-binding protein